MTAVLPRDDDCHGSCSKAGPIVGLAVVIHAHSFTPRIDGSHDELQDMIACMAAVLAGS